MIDDELRLELLELKHVQPLYELVDTNRKHLRAWLPWVDETTRPEHTKAFVRQSLARFGDNNGFDCAIVERGRLVGCIGLHEVDWPPYGTASGGLVRWPQVLERLRHRMLSRPCIPLRE
ncbi:GNAT family N-acetyltransferase [Paenibacillus sp. y28]